MPSNSQGRRPPKNLALGGASRYVGKGDNVPRPRIPGCVKAAKGDDPNGTLSMRFDDRSHALARAGRLAGYAEPTRFEGDSWTASILATRCGRTVGTPQVEELRRVC